MNRSRYYNYIEEQLLLLASKIESQAKKNLFTYHIHSENFYSHLLNKLYGWQLINLNAHTKNAEAIDLVDNSNLIVAQVSSTVTKQKIESSLSKDLKAYANKYTFKFISISKEAEELRKQTFKNPYTLKFDPKFDIYDIPSILNTVMSLSADQQSLIYEYIKSELESKIDPLKTETNLAYIIGVLSKEDWTSEVSHYQIDKFEVEKKITYNNLSSAKTIIEDYSVNSTRVEKIYAELNKLGANKSLAVLNSIRGDYIKNKSNLTDDALFFKIVESVIERIQNSANYVSIHSDELELCVNILVVDTFIRCKIFENPNQQTYVTA